MFEVGRTYRITTSDHDGISYRTAEILEVDFPLIKVSAPGNYEIINTASSSFVSAIPNDEKAKADEHEAGKEFAAAIDIRFVDDENKSG